MCFKIDTHTQIVYNETTFDGYQQGDAVSPLLFQKFKKSTQKDYYGKDNSFFHIGGIGFFIPFRFRKAQRSRLLQLTLQTALFA